MSIAILRHVLLDSSLAKRLLIAWLVLFSGPLSAQVTVSAGALRLAEVKTVYIAPASGDFVPLLTSRLEKWGALRITSQVEEADAVLTCETESRIVPAKMAVRQWDAQVRIVDRHSQKLIWSARKSASWEDNLAGAIVTQLKNDRLKSLTTE